MAHAAPVAVPSRDGLPIAAATTIHLVGGTTMNLKSISALAAAAMLGAGIPLGCGADTGAAALAIEDLTLIEENESPAHEANEDIQPRDRDADRVFVPTPDRIFI